MKPMFVPLRKMFPPLPEAVPPFEPLFKNCKSQELRIRELELAVEELKRNQITPWERRKLAKLED